MSQPKENGTGRPHFQSRIIKTSPGKRVPGDEAAKPLVLERPGWYWDGNPNHKAHWIGTDGEPICGTVLSLLEQRPMTGTITTTNGCNKCFKSSPK